MMGKAQLSRGQNTQHQYQPEYTDLYDEIARARELAAGPPDVQPIGQMLCVRNHGSQCTLTLAGDMWSGNCRYSRTHDSHAYPCCEVQAVNIWSHNRLLPNPRLMILDSNLVSGNRHTFTPGTRQHAIYNSIADVWREIAQGYVNRREDWDTVRQQHWYLICTACLVCPEDKLITEQYRLESSRTLQVLDGDLPEWFDMLRVVKDALVLQLKNPAWAKEPTFNQVDSICTWLEDRAQHIRDMWVTGQVQKISDRIRSLADVVAISVAAS